MPRKVANKKKQIALDFDVALPHQSDSVNPQSSSHRTDASEECVVLSFSEKHAEKREAHQNRLYEAILSRIRHLRA